MTLNSLKTAVAITVLIGLSVGAFFLVGGSPAGMVAMADKTPPRNDAEAIQGTWMVTVIEQVSHELSEDEKAYRKSGQCTITITADRLTFDVNKSAMSYRLDTTRTPRRMLWSETDDPRGGVVAIAVYELDGDSLKICLGQKGKALRPPEPPHGFDIKSAPRGTSPTLFVMKRMNELAQRDPGKAAAAHPPDAKPLLPRDGGLLHSNFDGVTFERILSGGREEPLFVDLDTGRFMTPPFALEPSDRGRPISLANLAFPDRLKSWVLGQGIDAAVQTDGRTITLLGLEMEDGEPLPESTEHSTLTPARALEGVNQAYLQRLRDKESKKWPRLVRTFETVDRPHFHLPFLTRQGGLGFLHLMQNFLVIKGHTDDSIRLNYQIERGLDLRFGGIARNGGGLTIAEPAILGDFGGFLIVVVDTGKIVLKQPGCLERTEIGQGQVRVMAGPTISSGILLTASRLMTGVLELDGRHERAKLSGHGKEATVVREGEKLRVTTDERTLECERITFGMPELRIFSIHPDTTEKPKK